MSPHSTVCRNGRFRKAFAGAAALLASAFGLPWALAVQAQEAGGFPEPSFPRWLADPSDESLLDAARYAVRQTSGRAPLGVVQDGQTVHVFLSYDQDIEVWEAIKSAWAERGVDAVGAQGWEWLELTKEEYRARAEKNLIRGPEGWKEFGVFEPAFIPFLPPEVQDTFGDPLTTTALLGGIQYTTGQRENAFAAYLDRHPEIENFFAFAGGRGHVQRLSGPEHAAKFKGNWIHLTKFDLLDKSSRFPSDLWKMIDETMVRPIPHVSEGTFRDPEGTRLHWVLTPEQARLWEEESGLSSYEPGHLNIYPPPARALWREGTIAAAGTHTGEWITMVDKGRLGVFDNPEIRALAARYGDPEVLFSYDWVPAIPGINVPGDYEEDYAVDPWGWISSVWERIKNGSYGYYVKDYEMFERPGEPGQ